MGWYMCYFFHRHISFRYAAVIIVLAAEPAAEPNDTEWRIVTLAQSFPRTPRNDEAPHGTVVRSSNADMSPGGELSLYW
jgi:hypothetical protein